MSVKDYLALWLERTLRRHRVILKSAITVSGGYNRQEHGGYAQLRVRLEPATQFEVSEAPPEVKYRIQKEATYRPDDFNIRKDELERFLDWAVLGFLDSTLMNEKAPKLQFRFLFEEIEYCPIESTEMSFKEAGRDAGRKVIEAFHSEWVDGTAYKPNQ
jgi:hypothetical protein